MKEAFTYMFKDPGYQDKASFYFIICFIALALSASPEITNLNTATLSEGPTVAPVTNPIFIILPIIGFFFNLILCGYYFTCIQAITKQNQNYVLPFLNIGNSFTKGFKFFLASILIGLVLSLFSFILALCAPVGIILLSILLFTLFFIWGNGFMWLFANKGKITTFLAWKKVAKLIKANNKTYFKNLILIILTTFASVIISLLFMLLFNFFVNNIYIAWTLTSIEGAIILSYTAFVNMYLIAKSINPETIV